MGSLSNLDNLNDRELQEILEIQKREEELKRRMQQDDCDIVQENGQLKFGGPPPNWEGPPPSKGCEVFVGKLPRDVTLEELYRVFSPIGKIYELRLMMEFSGFNRGFGFVEFSTKAEATRAIELMNDYELRPRHSIGVVKSVDNCRLFVGNLPKDKSADEIKSEMMRLTEGVKECIVYSSIADKTKNRGFAFVEYVNHRAASKARRKLIPERLHMWGNEIAVDWAAPEPEIDDEIMTKVTVLYVRNLSLTTTEQALSDLFNQAADGQVQKVKMMRDFAFVHFISRDVAEETMKKLNNTRFNGTIIEVTWAKPAREKNKISVGNLSSAGSGRSSSIGSRPSSRKTSEISLPCVSPRSSVYKPPHSSPPRCEQMKQRRFSTTSGPFSPVKQQQFHLPPLAMQSLNFMQHPGSNFLSLPPPPPIQLRNGEFGPSNFIVPTFPSVQQQTLDFNGNAMYCPQMSELTVKPQQRVRKNGITAPVPPMMNQTAAIENGFPKFGPPLHAGPQTWATPQAPTGLPLPQRRNSTAMLDGLTDHFSRLNCSNMQMMNGTGGFNAPFPMMQPFSPRSMMPY